MSPLCLIHWRNLNLFSSFSRNWSNVKTIQCFEKKLVSICPPTAASLCTFLGTHTWIWDPHIWDLNYQVSFTGSYFHWGRITSIAGTCSKMCCGLRYWKRMLIYGSKSDQIQTQSEYFPGIFLIKKNKRKKLINKIKLNFSILTCDTLVLKGFHIASWEIIYRVNSTKYSEEKE